LYPKELPVAVYAPDRKFAEFSVETNLKSETLDNVVDVFGAFKFNMIMGLTMGNLREDRRILEVFVDQTEAAVLLEEVVKILKEVLGVFAVGSAASEPIKSWGR